MRMLTINELDRVHGGLLRRQAVNSELSPDLGGGPPGPGKGAGGGDNGIWVPGPFGGSIHATPDSITYTTPNVPFENWGLNMVLGYVGGSGAFVTVNATDGGNSVNLTDGGGGAFSGSLTHTSGNSTFSFGITVNVVSNDIEMAQAEYTYHMGTNVVGLGRSMATETPSSERVHALAA